VSIPASGCICQVKDVVGALREAATVHSGMVRGEPARRQMGSIPEAPLPVPVGPSLVQAGGLLRYSQPAGPRRRGSREAVRGAIKAMSRKSRRRLILRLGSLNWEYYARIGSIVSFITLTTAPCYWGNTELLYRGLTKIYDYLRRLHGWECAFVRRELGAKRGMEHYHLMVIGPVVGTQADMERRWSEALGWEGEGRLRCSVETTGTASKVSKYLGKYCAKAAYEGAEREWEGPTGDADARREPCAEASGGDGRLSNGHNSEGGVCNGHRWWYQWGQPVVCEGDTYLPPSGDPLDFEGIRKMGVRVRRVWRRLREARAAVRAEKAVCGLSREVREWAAGAARREQKRRDRWLWGSNVGYTLIEDPIMIVYMVAAASRV